MWKPSDKLNWSEESLCSSSKYESYMGYWFDEDIKIRKKCIEVCMICPVRKKCLQWALENKQYWGVWGGLDETSLRDILYLSEDGEEVRTSVEPKCPFCEADIKNLFFTLEKIPSGGRWTKAKIVNCKTCTFQWRSRVVANKIILYQAQNKK